LISLLQIPVAVVAITTFLHSLQCHYDIPFHWMILLEDEPTVRNEVVHKKGAGDK